MADPTPAVSVSPGLPARRRVPLLSALLAVVGAVLGGSSTALADEFVDQLNRPFAEVREDRRSDTVLLPVLASLEQAPAILRRQADAALYPASGSSWGELEAWATGATQTAVLEALDTVTQETDYRRAMVFAQPYGITALGAAGQIDQIEAELYTSFGDPPLIAAAQHLYLDRFTDLAKLAHVEATRRLESGDAGGAIDVLIDLMMFGRQVLDREFHAEKVWALQTMIVALERVRDIVYTDTRGSASLTSSQLREFIERLRDERGSLALDRARLPRGDFIGTEQLIAMVMAPRGGVRPELFASTMARMGSTDRPLRLFGEAARWRDAAGVHADSTASREALSRIRNDYEFRWDRGPFDPRVTGDFHVAVLAQSPVAGDTLAVVVSSLPDMRDIFALRQILRTELIGTRNSLGLVGFRLDNNTYPLDLSAIRPSYIEDLGVDPFNPDQAAGRIPPLEFFVPIRDTRDRFPGRTTIPPHEISIVIEDAPNVSIFVRDDDFVLFSVGSDGAHQWADEVQNAVDAAPGRDFLIWPPVISVVRNTLVQSGRYD